MVNGFVNIGPDAPGRLDTKAQGALLGRTNQDYSQMFFLVSFFPFPPAQSMGGKISAEPGKQAADGCSFPWVCPL